MDTGQGTYNTIRLGMDTGGFNSGFLGEEATVITGAGNCQVLTRGLNLDDQHTRVRVDFGDGSGTGSNFLDVQQFSTTTLAEAPGADHVIVLEHAQAGASEQSKLATLLIEDESQVLDLDVNANGVGKVLETAHGTEVIDFTVALDGRASIEGQSTIGTFTIQGKADFLGTSSPSTVNSFDIGAQSVPTSTGIVEIFDEADVTALTNSKIGTLNFPETPNSGKLTLQPRPTPHTSTNARKLIVKSLSMNPSNASLLDLKDNVMIIDYTGTSPWETILSLLASAHNGGAWTGGGLGSSTAAAAASGHNKTGLGYGEATDIRTSFPTTWDGQTVDNTSLLVKYTFYGDADLDGMVNLADFNRVAADFGNSPRRWTHGDFTYDALVGLADFNHLAANFGASGLGDGDAGDIEDISQEKLMEMWEEATS